MIKNWSIDIENAPKQQPVYVKDEENNECFARLYISGSDTMEHDGLMFAEAIFPRNKTWVIVDENGDATDKTIIPVAFSLEKQMKSFVDDDTFHWNYRMIRESVGDDKDDEMIPKQKKPVCVYDGFLLDKR